MGRGVWSRWNNRKGFTEAYSLSIGNLITGSVRKNGDRWETSIGTVPLEAQATKAEAMALIETRIQAAMQFALEDWAIYTERK
jgi:hypothetical protein